MKKEKLSDVDAYRAACVVASIGFYFLGKYLNKLNYEILNINLFTVLSWLCYFIVAVGIINFIKTLITGKRVDQDWQFSMSVNIISMNDFNKKVKMYIPTHEVSIAPRLGDVEGRNFDCGCGETHVMNFEEHFFVADGGMFKGVFLSPDCGFLNCLKLKKLFSKKIETLFSTKFLINEPNYGFNDYPNISHSIDMFKGYFRK